MQSFPAILHRALANSGLKQREFARRVRVSPNTISQALAGKHTPRWKRGPDWAAALGLKGQEARDFVLALAIANSPPAVQQLLARSRPSSP